MHKFEEAKFTQNGPCTILGLRSTYVIPVLSFLDPVLCWLACSWPALQTRYTKRSQVVNSYGHLRCPFCHENRFWSDGL